MEAQKNEYNIGLNERVIGVYRHDEGEKVLIDGITKSCAYPRLGFRSVVKPNEILLICTKFTEKSKPWETMRKTN